MSFLLRKINKNDIDYCYNIKSNSNVCKYLGNTKINNYEDTKAWIENIFNETNTDRFVIINQDLHEICGDICIGDINYIDLSCSLHIKILPEYWGKGVGSLTINKIIIYCKDVLSLKVVYLSINNDNLRSKTLFEKYNLTLINNDINFNNYKINL